MGRNNNPVKEMWVALGSYQTQGLPAHAQSCGSRSEGYFFAMCKRELY
jgi:hypothetical protein